MAKNARVREDELPERVSLHEQKLSILDLPEKKGFHRKWVNDTHQGRNVQRHLKAGYRIIEETGMQVGGGNVDFPATQLGTGIRKSVGGGIEAIAMELPNEDFEADQKKKLDRARDKEKRIFEGKGFEGIDGKTSVETREGTRKQSE